MSTGTRRALLHRGRNRHPGTLRAIGTGSGGAGPRPARLKGEPGSRLLAPGALLGIGGRAPAIRHPLVYLLH